MSLDTIINHLNSISDKNRLRKMERFGIDTTHALGISVKELRLISKKIAKNHDLALSLWDTTIHEARMLAALIDIPKKVTEEQMDEWAHDFNSWDLCDHSCFNLFDKTKFARKKIDDWSESNEEFVKRAAFSLIAALAVHDKKSPNHYFEDFFPVIVRESNDHRTYVKKAISWSLRNIGKRNQSLNEKSIKLAKDISKQNNKNSLWIAKDVIRELSSTTVQNRIKKYDC